MIRRETALVYAMFAAGLALGLVMALRSQASVDQVRFLVLGWHFAELGELLPFGTGMSRGGLVPGSASGLLVGAPLKIWGDYRSASLVTLAMHAVAFLLLDSVVKRCLGARGRVLFAAVYWLNPWRIYYGSHLWNPNWMFWFGAFHLWTCYHMRERRSFWLSTLQVLSVGIAFQLHGSFLTLAVISVLLWWRGYLRVHWLGIAVGVGLSLASLIPWMIASEARPEILPMHGGTIGRGFLFAYPLLKGLSYLCFRFPSLYTDRHTLRYDFTPEFGAAADAWMAPTMETVVVLAKATVVFAILAQWWFWRTGGRAGFARREDAADERTWLLGAARWGFVGSAVTFGLSPTTIMSYQVFIVFHLAVLPLVFWLEQLRLDTRVRRGIAGAVAAITVVTMFAQCLAAPMYRSGGRDEVFVKLQHEHPLPDDVGLTGRVRVEIDPEWGTPLDPYEYARSRDSRE